MCRACVCLFFRLVRLPNIKARTGARSLAVVLCLRWEVKQLEGEAQASSNRNQAPGAARGHPQGHRSPTLVLLSALRAWFAAVLDQGYQGVSGSIRNQDQGCGYQGSLISGSRVKSGSGHGPAGPAPGSTWLTTRSFFLIRKCRRAGEGRNVSVEAVHELHVLAQPAVRVASNLPSTPPNKQRFRTANKHGPYFIFRQNDFRLENDFFQTKTRWGCPKCKENRKIRKS